MKPDRASVFTSGQSDEDKLGRFIGGSSVSVVSSVVAGLFALGWAASMAALGPESFSILGPYMQCFWILTALVSFGVPHTLITFISHNYEQDFDTAREIAMQGNKLLFVLVACFTAAALCVTAALWFSGRVQGLYIALCLIMIVAVLARQMYFGVFASMSGLQRLDYASLSNVIFSVFLPFMSLGLLTVARRLYPGNTQWEILAGAGGIGVSAAIAYAVGMIICTRTQLPPSVLYSFRKPLTRWKEILTFGWVTNVALVGNTIMGLIPPIYVSYFMAHGFGWYGATLLENKTQAGIFSAAFTFAMAPMLVMGLTFALIPAMSEAHARGNRPLMNKYFNTSVKYCFSIVAMLTAVYAVVIGRFVYFFTGGQYPVDVVHGIALYLEMGVGANALFFLLASMLVALKRPAVAARAICVVLALEVGAMTLAGKLTGDIDITAWGMAGSIAAGALFLFTFMATKLKMELRLSLFAPPVVSALAMWVLCRALPAPGRFGFFIPCMVGPPFFFFVDGLLGGIGHDDLNTVRQTLESLRLGFLCRAVDLAQKIFSLSPFFPEEDAKNA